MKARCKLPNSHSPRRRRRNAALADNELAAAVELSESWSGRKPRKVTQVSERIKARSDLADLGGLEELVVLDRNNEKYEYCLRFGHDVRVAAAIEPASGEARQLYFVGGNQELDLEEFSIDGARDKEVIGRVASITYHTAKHHLGQADKTPGSYTHEFGEEGGELPTLIYDGLNRTIELAGGSYTIKLDDYDGKHSAGIRN